jgi:hypothetical protein
MFGYRGGEPADVLRRKTLERKSAKDEWPFLTTLDLSTIHSEQQLAAIVKDRTGLKMEAVAPSVHAWMEGYNRRLAAPPLSQGKVVNMRQALAVVRRAKQQGRSTSRSVPTGESK